MDAHTRERFEDFMRRKQRQDDELKARHQPPEDDLDNLDDIAERINNLHDGTLGLFRTASDHAIRIGHLLIRAKAMVNESWEGWVTKNTKLSTRTAQRYMKFARHAENHPELAPVLVALTITENEATIPGKRKKKKGGGRAGC